MKKIMSGFGLVLMMTMLLSWLAASPGAGDFEQVTGEAFDKALPKDFYLEGNAIPTEKRNAVLLKTPAGARVLFALIDTTGYSSQIQQKYAGMLITESPIAVGGVKVNVGSYGFGLDRPRAPSAGEGKLRIYNQAGKEIGGTAATKDDQINPTVPLQVVRRDGKARLYVGRYWVELR